MSKTFVSIGVDSDAGVIDFTTTEKIMNVGTMAVLQENS